MRVEIVAVMHHLVLPEAFKRKKLSVPNFPGIRLEKNGSQLNFIDSHMHEELGSMQVKEINSSVCFFTSATLEEKDLSFFERKFIDYIATFIDALWLVKDNSVSSDFELCKFGYGKSHFTRRVFIHSDSHCDYKDMDFSKDEIEEAVKWFDLMVKPKNVDSAKIAHSETSSVPDGIINMDKGFPYATTNRFQRALRFVSVARKQTELQPRITYYISALESLLSTSDSALTMQVSDRGARILGEDYDEKVKIKKIISIAYSFRSKYIHGAVSTERSMKKSLKFLGSVEELSEEMDDILRRLIKVYLTDLSHVPLLSDEDFSIWIDELLYK
ncbi:hypothetical protein BHE17_08725 [Planococcus maritimus]|uniref:HEPN domain-containing protein n=1 Tax=Planococcus maritimus TaxID=192421 RepID=UPI00084C51F8|nr:HEPN domain-containing protein [Planococcus maritimus]OED32520.1 hypothetical protein BHE17_08725 [Planococcus maritimus]